MTDRWERYAPLTGVIFVALLVISFIVAGDTPDIDDPALQVARFYRENDGDQITSGILGAYAVVFFLFFNGRLRRTLRSAEVPTAGGLSNTAFAGGILLAVGGAIFSALTFTLGDSADDISVQSVQAIHALNSDLFFPLATGTGVFLLAAGGSVLRSGVLPRWLGWTALLIGVVAVTPLGFFGFLAALAWVLVTSVVLTLRGAAPDRAAAVPPTP